MVMLRKKTTVVTDEPKPVLKEDILCGDLTFPVDDSSTDSAVKHLRRRCELASVLNFLNVFGPLVSDKLKLTAEEIEMGLIESNATNAQLHIALLKGIRPANKLIDETNGWITVLCKKLAPWWPWIAKGEIPITANNGEEIAEYQGLDPINRLRFLKALCELRVQEDDARAYIQENAKEEDWPSSFRKRKLGGDGQKTSYWFDGSDIQGYRLYKEIIEIKKSSKARKNASSGISCLCWETEATNLDEFQKVARELSSSKSTSLVATGEKIETDAIPVVEKYHQKKERAKKRKMKKEMVVDVNFSRPIRRSCRNRIPAIYTFDKYDRMINEAVEETEENDGDDEEGREQQIAAMDSNDSAEDNKVKATEDAATESNNAETERMKWEKQVETKTEDENVIKKSKEREFSGKNRLRQRLTRNSALC